MLSHLAVDAPRTQSRAYRRGLRDEQTLAQLASIRYQHNPRGQVMIESKDDARRRGVKSPDRAEALMLAFADRTPGIIRYYEEQARLHHPDATFNNPAVPRLEDDDDDDDITATYEQELRRLELQRR